MTIGAISSSYYSQPTQDLYLGTSVSNTQIHDLMKEYGLYETGNTAFDLQQLHKAMYSKASSDLEAARAAANQQAQALQQNSQPTGAQNASNVPWAALMNQVGLSATGDLETDIQSFNNKISAMQLSATSPKDKASINLLEAEASIVFVQQDQSTTGASQIQTSNSSSSVSGADIVAQLNKMYVVSF